MNSPLRPQLYDRLAARSKRWGFGGVLVTHDGEAMVAHVDYDWENNGRPKLNVEQPGEYYRVNCPFCGDTRHRLWINHMWGHRDARTGGLNLWLAYCYNEDCLAKKPGRPRELYDMVFDDITNGHPQDDYVLKGEKPTHGPREVKWPADDLPLLSDLPPDHPAVAYMRSRGYDPVWLGQEFGVSYCLVAHPDFQRANDRIIIPMYMHGMPVGWQARYLGEPRDRSVGKYYTMPGMKKKEVLYNFDRAMSFPFVVITEGVTKVWSVGPEAVATLGDHLSSYQASLIAGTFKAAVVYYDGDAFDHAMEAYDALGRTIKKALVKLPEDKEPGDFTPEYNRRLIYHTARKQGVFLPESLLQEV